MRTVSMLVAVSHLVLLSTQVDLRHCANVEVDESKIAYGFEEYLKLVNRLMSDEGPPLPDFVDWRQHGRVGPIRVQGKCNSCWAFGALGMLEGQQWAVLNTNTGGNHSLIELSVQNLIDCCAYGDDGYRSSCAEGRGSDAFQNIQRMGGVMAAKDYPYEGQDGNECRFNKSLSIMSFRYYNILWDYDEMSIAKIVARYGPVAASVDCGGHLFRDYKSGVHYDPECKKNEFRARHAVLIVGYGSDEKEGDYWLVKNTWGENWGEGGYIRMARNKDSNCNIAHQIYFVVV